LLLIFISEENKYNLVNSVVERELDYQLIDIESDGKNELLVEKKNQHKWDVRSVTIYSHKNDKLDIIFDEYLAWSNNKCAYSVYNEFDFKPNPDASNILDIEFNVRTFIDDYNSINENEAGAHCAWFDFPKVIDEVYVFKFDGERYVSDRPVFEYKK